MLHHSFSRLLVAAFFLLCGTGLAHAQLAKTEIDWVKEWDKIVPSQHSVKDSLIRTLDRCAGPSIKPSDIKVYQYDINKDGLEDYAVDLRAIGKDVKTSTCDDLPCVGPDCYQWHYINKDVGLQQIFLPKADKAPACPAKAEDNKECLSHCPATLAQCPLLYRDVFYIVWNGRAGDWTLYEANKLPQGRSLAPDTSGSHVLSMTLTERASLCSDAEIVQNGGKCVKFYQWDPLNFILTDIYKPVITSAGTWPEADRHNLTRWNRNTLQSTKGPKAGDGYGFRLTKTPTGQNYSFALNILLGSEDLCPVECPAGTPTQPDAEVCREELVEETVTDCGDDFGRQTVGDVGGSKNCTTKTVVKKKLVCVPKDPKIGGKDIKRTSTGCYKTCYKNARWTCLDVKSTAAKDYFVPNNTADEFNAFYANLPSGVSTDICERRYTAWTGHAVIAPLLGRDTQLTTDYCAYIAADIPCDTSVNVSVTRECEASLGLALECGQCNADTRIPNGQRRLACGQSITCYGPVCPTIGSSDGGSDGGGGDGGGN